MSTKGLQGTYRQAAPIYAFCYGYCNFTEITEDPAPGVLPRVIWLIEKSPALAAQGFGFRQKTVARKQLDSVGQRNGILRL